MRRRFIPKRLPVPQSMDAAERQYIRNLMRYQRMYVDLVRDGLDRIIHPLKREASEEIPESIRTDSQSTKIYSLSPVKLYICDRADNTPGTSSVPHFDANIEWALRMLFKEVQTKLVKAFPDKTLRAWSEAMVSHVNFISKKNMGNLGEAVDIDVEPLMRDKELTPYFKNVVDENVGLIRSIPVEKMASFKNSLVYAITNDHPQDKIKSMIEENFGATHNKAKLIAVDQINKLNGKVSQYRQQQLGGKRYRWRNSKDERVAGNPSGLYPHAKPSHWNRENEIFSWDNPPEGGHPGQRIRCRCTAEMVLDDVLD